jgi:hypothetical protein
MGFIIGGIVLIFLGFVLIKDPTLLLLNKEVMSKKINTAPKYKMIFRIVGYWLVVLGVGLILDGIAKGWLK